VASAFGFSGQKCSACSRVIVDDAVYDRFLTALVAKAEALRVGDPADPATDVGPVINPAAVAKISDYLETARGEGRVVLGGTVPDGEGYFIAPTIVADVEPGARIAQEEIFGPVLAVLRAQGFEHALAIANDTEFGLTGGVYTRDRERIARAVDAFFVGNLYINRKCTGALVGVHPFGGFNLSGTDSKAGGPDYLPLFQQAKAITVARSAG
jgi:1-pyrroline-5-carboxylate dehydrogenase